MLQQKKNSQNPSNQHSTKRLPEASNSGGQSGVSLKPYDLGRGTLSRIFCLLTSVGIAWLEQDTCVPVDPLFLVPYQRNALFTGRVMNSLREKILNQTSDKVNHRVALHGKSGVGKTQCALEYTYAHKINYDRIYWIDGVDQASLLSGYQAIAETIPEPTFKTVLQLGRQKE